MRWHPAVSLFTALSLFSAVTLGQAVSDYNSQMGDVTFLAA